MSKKSDKSAAVIAAHRSGMTMDEIAAKFHICLRGARKILRAAGIPPRRGHPYGSGRKIAVGDPLELWIVAQYRKERTAQAIAREVGVHWGSVLRILREHGESIRAPYTEKRRCVECDKITVGKLRCRYHAKVRHAEIARESKRKQDRIKPNRYRLDL